MIPPAKLENREETRKMLAQMLSVRPEGDAAFDSWISVGLGSDGTTGSDPRKGVPERSPLLTT